MLNLEKHPCFNQKACRSYARIHLPVAPHCNVQCRFCNRKYSCVNESRPGVTAKVMTPHEALEHLKRNMEKSPNISVVGIAGPGDPFANADETLDTFRLVQNEFPELMLCVSSNGLNVLPYVDDLKSLNVTHVTITVNAIDFRVGAEIYDWVRWGGHDLTGMDAAFALWENQQAAIEAIHSRNILVKVNTVCIPSVNEFHVEEISKAVAALGASLHNVIPLIPTANTAFAHLTEPTPAEMQAIRLSAQRHLPQMAHCSRCRADAVGLLGQKHEGSEDHTIEFAAHVDAQAPVEVRPNTIELTTSERPYIAVASREGACVNLHLGEAPELHIYNLVESELTLKEIRRMPSVDCGQSRWKLLAESLQDCAMLLASGVGPFPRSILNGEGIKVLIAEGNLQDVIFHAKTNHLHDNEKSFQCGESCGGDARGCEP